MSRPLSRVFVLLASAVGAVGATGCGSAPTDAETDVAQTQGALHWEALAECVRTGPCALDEGVSCSETSLPCRPGMSCDNGVCMPPSDWGTFRTVTTAIRWYEPELGGWVGTIAAASSQVLPVHAALLHTGSVLFFAGDEHQEVGGRDDEFGADPLDTVRIFDTDDLNEDAYLSYGGIRNPGPPQFDDTPADAFCAGHAQDPLGRGLYVVGGTAQFPSELDDGGIHDIADHFTGLEFATVFDAEEEAWVEQPATLHGHWYPTVISYPTDQGDPDGVWAFEGHAANDSADHNAPSEVIVAGSEAAGWEDVGKIRTHEEGHYPRVFGLPSGHVFSASKSIGSLRDGDLAPEELM